VFVGGRAYIIENGDPVMSFERRDAAYMVVMSSAFVTYSIDGVVVRVYERTP